MQKLEVMTKITTKYVSTYVPFHPFNVEKWPNALMCKCSVNILQGSGGEKCVTKKLNDVFRFFWWTFSM